MVETGSRGSLRSIVDKCRSVGHPATIYMRERGEKRLQRKLADTTRKLDNILRKPKTPTLPIRSPTACGSATTS
ncbi:hypothetical protein YIM_32525 [Amycolatopsis sp. YIM 10]|nr:hypothetical protein YIM_32525 [Amycolatopsis sp. YIM 10]